MEHLNEASAEINRLELQLDVSKKYTFHTEGHFVQSSYTQLKNMENRWSKHAQNKTKLMRNVKGTPPWELLESLSLLSNIYPEGANEYDTFVFNISKHKVWKSQNS